MEQILFISFGAITALAGSLIQLIINRRYDIKDKKEALLIEAYGDYLSGLSKRASILAPHSERTEEATALMLSGKQKIAAFAPYQVVLALAKLETTPMELSAPETQEAMGQLILRMKDSVNAEKGDLSEAIQDILFGSVSLN